ncbi:MAG: pantoate--beta-alanine ligase [Deltaproteobacteria bacterium]|nr:pantoate--beta-alanine ligase [Deltaproteobacteria bacterium]
MKVIEDIAGMRSYVSGIKARGDTIGLVPTMGYLHEGHLSLMRKARELTDHVVISIFVNPTQFGPNEDLDRYPRDFERDLDLASSVGVECIFHPRSQDIYPKGYATYIHVEGLSSVLCGVSRPTHFRGVATVVAKLFNIVEPDIAVFGEKDYQQLVIIRRMVADLNMKVKIVGYPIVREKDGLAMSSRNRYLSQQERKKATVLSRALKRAEDMFNNGERDASAIREALVEMIMGEDGCNIDYVEIVDADYLSRLRTIDRKAVIALAVNIGKARLIDNTILDPSL